MANQADHYIIAINPPEFGSQPSMISQILSANSYEQGKASVNFNIISGTIDENVMLGIVFKLGYTPENVDWDRSRFHNLSGLTHGKLLAIYKK